MRSVERLYIDANIFILLGEDRGEVAQLLYRLFSLYEPGGPGFFCTSELTLAELIVRPYREKNDDLLRTYETWIGPGSAFDVFPVDRTVLWNAAVIRSRYRSVKLPDAIHLSTAARLECSHILTGDKKIPDVVEVLAGGSASGSARLEALRPTPSILHEIIESQAAR